MAVAVDATAVHVSDIYTKFLVMIQIATLQPYFKRLRFKPLSFNYTIRSVHPSPVAWHFQYLL